MMGGPFRKLLLGAALIVHRGTRRLILKLSDSEDAWDSDTEKAPTGTRRAFMSAVSSAGTAGGPPKHWVDRVKQYAPELLLPTVPQYFSHDSHAGGRMEEGGRENKHEVSAGPGGTPGQRPGFEMVRKAVPKRALPLPRKPEKARAKGAIFPDEVPEKPTTRRTLHAPEIRSPDTMSQITNGDASADEDFGWSAAENRQQVQESVPEEDTGKTSASGRLSKAGAPTFAVNGVEAAEADDSRMFGRPARSAIRGVGETQPAPHHFEVGSARARGKKSVLPPALQGRRREKGASLDAVPGRFRSPAGNAMTEHPDGGKAMAGTEASDILIHPTARGNRLPNLQMMDERRSNATASGWNHDAAEPDGRHWPRLPDEDSKRPDAGFKHSDPWPLLWEEVRGSGETEGESTGLADLTAERRSTERLRRVDREQAGEIWNAWPF